MTQAERGQRIVADFEGLFGKITATERDWLARTITDALSALERTPRLPTEEEIARAMIGLSADHRDRRRAEPTPWEYAAMIRTLVAEQREVKP